MAQIHWLYKINQNGSQRCGTFNFYSIDLDQDGDIDIIHTASKDREWGSSILGIRWLEMMDLKILQIIQSR